jgi:hypothetical protein
MKKTTKTTKSASAPTTDEFTTTTAIAPAPAPKPARVPKIKKAETTDLQPAAEQNGAISAPAVIITAKIDVGFGNRLFIRGDGPGLSWDQGTLLDCVADDRWVASISGAHKPFIFKFLLNDEVWSIGDDYVVEPGASFTITPLF